jgi:ABC-type spermidine/putrescine transport system permease subunit II
MVIYALARRGVSPELNAVSTVLIVGLGALVLFSERLRTK